MSVIDAIPIDQISVRVRNNGDKELKGQAMQYASAEYRIPPGGERVMPWLAACHFFGDPRAVNKGDARETQYRQAEVERLQVHWGTYDTEWYSEVPITTPGGGDEHLDWKHNPVGHEAYVANRDLFMHPNLPRVEIFRSDNNESVVPVINDPNGDGMVEPDQSALELETLTQSYNRLKDQLDRLAQEVQFRDPAALNGPELDPLDNIPVAEVGVDSAAVGADAPDTIVDSLVDPTVPDAPATEDSPRRPVPKKGKTT